MARIEFLPQLFNFVCEKVTKPSPFLKELHWLPVKKRIQYKILLYVYKCINGSAPEYLSSLLALYCPVRKGLRSSSDTTRLVQHSIHKQTLKSAADQTFYYKAPSLWNNLPISTRSATTLPTFKKALKHHLFND